MYLFILIYRNSGYLQMVRLMMTYSLSCKVFGAF